MQKINLAAVSGVGGVGLEGGRRPMQLSGWTSVQGWEGPDGKRELEANGIPASENILQSGFGHICSRILLVVSFESHTFYFMLNIVRGSSGRFILIMSQLAWHTHF